MNHAEKHTIKQSLNVLTIRERKILFGYETIEDILKNFDIMQIQSVIEWFCKQ